MSLIDNVTPDMESYQHEIIGPVLEVVRVPDPGTSQVDLGFPRTR